MGIGTSDVQRKGAPRFNFTKKALEGLPSPPQGQRFYAYDLKVRGLAVQVTTNGVVSFQLYRKVKGRPERITLGRFPDLTIERARARAAELNNAIAQGANPAEAKRAYKGTPDLTSFANRYLTEYAQDRKKARSTAEDRRILNKTILPAFGSRKVAEVTRADVLKLHASMRATPYQANRVVALLSKMFNLAEAWGLRPDSSNPCRHVARFKEAKRERFLSSAELACLGKVLTEAERYEVESPSAVAAIRLLLFTGCRLSEILTLRWQEVDSERTCLRLADSKTGAKVVHLNAPALEVLAGLKREEGNPYVIAGPKQGAHLNDLETPWQRIREGAGLPEVRLHDLRHSFASVGAGARLGLVIIGKLLGHTQPATTARYSHLDADPLKQASEAIGQRIAAALKGKRAKVVTIQRTKKK